jgi:predicted  nucleic acid-binding Zn-ribbon protein
MDNIRSPQEIRRDIEEIDLALDRVAEELDDALDLVEALRNEERDLWKQHDDLNNELFDARDAYGELE